MAVESSLENAVALDTSRSVVVEACAGSGKTWLLSSRIARALVEGIAPKSILALTFTNKAAAEMRIRVIDHLREMATLSEQDLRQKFTQWGMSGEGLQQAMARAPDALHRFLMDPHPPTISTFHSWYIRLAAMAPIKVAGWATMALSQRSWDLMRQAWQVFYANEVDRVPYQELVVRMGSFNVRKAMEDWVLARVEWRAFAASIAHGRASAEQVRQAFDQVEQQNAQAVAQFYAAHAARAQGLAQAYAQVDKREDFQALLARWDASDCDALCKAFLTVLKGDDQWKTGAPRRLQLKGGNDRFVRKTKDIPVWGDQADAHTQDVLTLGHEFMALLEACDQRRAQVRTQALWLCSDALARCFDTIMTRRHETDFAGLELKAWDLLGGECAPAFHARLDTQMSHVLVDEFQDTNPVQWMMLREWLAQYGQDDAGLKASAPKVFIVGDPKQSIYRFRRADPQVFQVASQWLVRHYGAVRQQANTTRRCGEPIVTFLNQLMPTLAGGHRFMAHATLADDHGGRVARLPLAADRETEGAQLADALHALRAEHRELAWSDMRILVRTRTHMQSYETALTQAGIPFVSDRTGGLLSAPEVLDLMALLRFLAYPWSDHDLAHTLKSPIMGLTDLQLGQVAVQGWPDRALEATEMPSRSRRPRSASLFDRLRHLSQQEDCDPEIRAAAACLDQWTRWATQLPVHDVLDRIIHVQDVMDRMAARFGGACGLQCLANVEAFVALALELDTGRLPSLPRFLHELNRWAQAKESDTPSPGVMPSADAVVVSTLHAAKGLEAKVVVLAGLMDREPGDKGLRWLIHWNAERDGIVDVAAWQNGDPFTPTVEAALRDDRRQEEEEDFNLLYVGITRAKQVLLFSATGEDRSDRDDLKPRDQKWFEKISTACDEWVPPARHTAVADSIAAGHDPMVAPVWRGLRWDKRPMAPEMRVPTETLAMRQGKALHRLMEFGPRAALAMGQSALAQRLLAEFALPASARTQVWQAVATIAASPMAAIVFDPNRLAYAEAEWPVALTPGDTIMRPDRVVRIEEHPETWWIIDFKWNVLDSELADYAQQLESYRREFQAIRPQAAVEARIITAQAQVWALSEGRLVHFA